MDLIKQIEGLNKKIEVLMKEKTKSDAQREMLEKRLDESISSYEEEYGVKLSGKNLKSTEKLVKSEMEKVSKEAKEEYDLSYKVVQAIENSNYDLARKLLGSNSVVMEEEEIEEEIGEEIEEDDDLTLEVDDEVEEDISEEVEDEEDEFSLGDDEDEEVEDEEDEEDEFSLGDEEEDEEVGGVSLDDIDDEEDEEIVLKPFKGAKIILEEDEEEETPIKKEVPKKKIGGLSLDDDDEEDDDDSFGFGSMLAGKFTLD